MTKEEMEKLESIERYYIKSDDEAQLEYLEKWWQMKEERAEKKAEKRKSANRYFNWAMMNFKSSVKFLRMGLKFYFESIIR